MDESKNLLEEAIIAGFEDLKTLNPGSEEQRAAVDDLIKLYRLKIDQCKAEDGTALKETEQDLAQQTKDADRKERQKERWIRVAIAGGEIIIPLAFYTVFMVCGFKFEETGVWTSPTFKGLIKFFRPTKR